MDADCGSGEGGGAVIGLIIAVILGILLIGIVMLAQDKFGQNRDSGRLK